MGGKYTISYNFDFIFFTNIKLLKKPDFSYLALISIQIPLGRPKYGKSKANKKHERSSCEKCTIINDLCQKLESFSMSDSTKVKSKRKNKTDKSAPCYFNL